MLESSLVVTNTGEQLKVYVCGGCMAEVECKYVFFHQPKATFDRLVEIETAIQGQEGLPN